MLHPPVIWRSCSTFSNRGAKTMYIFRQSLIGTTAPSLSSNGCVKSNVTWYFVLLSPFANRRLVPLPVLAALPHFAWLTDRHSTVVLRCSCYLHGCPCRPQLNTARRERFVN